MIDDMVDVRLPVQLGSFLLAQLQCGSRAPAEYTSPMRWERWLRF